jgi:hypothetical protein
MSIPHISTETYHRSSRPRRPYEVSESPRLQLRPLWDAAPLPVLWSQMAPVGSWRPPLATRRMLDDVGWCGMMWDDVGWVFFMDFEWLLILCWYCVDIVGIVGVEMGHHTQIHPKHPHPLPSAKEPLSHVRDAVWKLALPHLIRGLGQALAFWMVTWKPLRTQVLLRTKEEAKGVVNMYKARQV